MSAREVSYEFHNFNIKLQFPNFFPSVPSGDVARALFIRSKLPLPDLTKIWYVLDNISCYFPK